MFQVSKQTQSHTNKFGAMESGDHFKNGASRKSHTSRGNFMSKFLAFVLITTAVACINSCGKEDKDTDTVAITTDEGVVINGVRWATRNLDAPGTFSATPESAGKVYQWNRKVAYPVKGSVSNWDETETAGDTWEKANDPSPVGYRVPTKSEISSLLDENCVSNEWTTQNGVNGRKFTDKATGNNIFLPATGWRVNSILMFDEGEEGYYWSSTQSDMWDDFAHLLIFDATTANIRTKIGSVGNSIRAVAE